METEKVTTKSRILDAALTLFSEKGYDGVGVDLIAETVGLKGPSLYRHFKGKEDILNSLVDMFEDFYEERFGNPSEIEELPVTAEALAMFTIERVRFTLQDEQQQKMRKLLAMEQFRNKDLAMLTTKHHLAGVEDLYTVIFEKMIENGFMRDDDPRLLSFEYVSPIILMIQLCDRAPWREEEVMNRIRTHIEHFLNTYRL